MSVEVQAGGGLSIASTCEGCLVLLNSSSRTVSQRPDLARHRAVFGGSLFPHLSVWGLFGPEVCPGLGAESQGSVTMESAAGVV